MVDLPAGATGRIANNLFVQGSDKENRSALIAVAAEGADNPSRGLAITGNRASLSPETSWPSVFVADWSGESLATAAHDLGPRLPKLGRRKAALPKPFVPRLSGP